MKEILTFREALQLLGVSKSFLYKLTSSRSIRFYKPNNGKLYFKRKDLEEWMLQNEKPTLLELEKAINNNLKNKGRKNGKN
ncbi:MAG: helix-turn-helix domain-containing protein [Fermentimonas sp.]